MSVADELDFDAVVEGYSEEEKPLAEYATLIAAFAATVSGALIAARASGRELPESVSVKDVATVGIATHKLSRLISKSKVASPIRAPFTRYQGPAGRAEVDEAPRGEGLRYAVGQLLVCPHCLSQWISAGFGVGLVAAPRVTRLVAASYSAMALSDFLQIAYRAAQERA